MAGISDDDALTCEDCGGELSFYQLGINFTNNDVVMQVGNEKRNVTEFVTKSSTQSGAKANAGVSSSGPKASGGGFVQNVNAVEDKDATSNAKSFSITQSSGYTVQLTWLNPENIDQSNYQFRSGCIDPDCPNSIINDINNRLKNRRQFLNI